MSIRNDVVASAAGDGEAYARIIRRFRPALNRRMRRFASGAADLDELVHDVFVETYFSLKRFRGDGPFEHWLQRIATRVGFRRWKLNRAKTRNAQLPADLIDRVRGRSMTDLTPAEADESLALLLSRLSPRDRLVVTLMHIECHSVEETARLTGWSMTMVKVQAHRARGKLRKLIGEGL